MTAPTVKSDYDQLKSVSQSFSAQAEALQGMIQNLHGREQQLESGDWIGQGATAFFQEWQEQDLPTLQRLASALSDAASITNQISRNMKEAEDSASKTLHFA